MKNKVIFIFALVLVSMSAFAQGNPPWERPLLMATSSDGRIFSTPSLFQDSSGVPSVIRWQGDTLICAFQWFRQPMGSPSWDRVAVKYSYDAGQTWTEPTPIVVNGLPTNYQRPFDPTLVAIPGTDSIRIFYSSSEGTPPLGLDSTINCYSAASTDGVNYTFEPGPRYDRLHEKLIDPAVAIFNGTWHYTAPAGAPQDGAYHCTAMNGLNFTNVGHIASDATHNWTGNLMLESPTQMRFYGSGANIWYRSTMDGTGWAPYQTTNLVGGDPSVLKVANGNYLIVYVGAPGFVATSESTALEISVYPNPGKDRLRICGGSGTRIACSLHDLTGKLHGIWTFETESEFDVSEFAAGTYFLHIDSPTESKTVLWIKE
jgi:hypothetical protein